MIFVDLAILALSLSLIGYMVAMCLARSDGAFLVPLIGVLIGVVIAAYLIS